jgi:lipoprotein-anchoring transpeptidase ErfK/SrfK
VYNADCVVEAEVPGALDLLVVGETGDEVSGFDLWAENDFLDRGLVVGDLVDVCVDNQVNDVSGEPRIGREDPIVAAAVFDDVKRQQEKLNQLFAGFGIAELEVDGVSGRRTRQRLCAARLALGMPTSTTDMQPGTAEHLGLFLTETLPTPASTAIESERWILIDRTCQIMFIGEGRDTIDVFATSTGTEGFETRDQNRVNAFRFNPASDNGGWHDSSEYPVGVDNPLNGNMYKPLYFDLGQAIHGANSVPTAPASKGCARLRVQDQITLLEWLGLNETTNSIWKASEIQVTVNVQGEYISR